MMNSFEEAYYKTNLIEGGYANDPQDKGGETYRGVSRKFHSNWPGWKIIDNQKGNKSFPACLDEIAELQDLIKTFYYKEFWLKIGGDFIPDQALAEEIYDNAVNMGIVQSIKYLQRSLNILNNNGSLYPDITVDGIPGAGTNAALKDCIEKRGAQMLLNVVNGYQIKHYLELMEKDSGNEKYIGWFKRVKVNW